MPFLVIAVTYIVVEAYVLFWAADLVGVLRVFLALGAFALIGFYLVRSQGLNAFNRANHALARGESPHVEMLDGIVLLICGIVLIIPGLVSDILVLPMLVPFFRRRVVKRMAARMGHIGRPGHTDYPGSFTSRMNNEPGERGSDAQNSGAGPFVFYRFFMSGPVPRQKPEQYKEAQNDYFDAFDSSEIIDVTPREQESLDGKNSEISDFSEPPDSSSVPEDGDSKK